MENRKNMIKLCDIKKNYDFESPQSEHIQRAEVLKGIDMEIREGEYISIMGRSGSGKTTLLKIIGLMLPPTAGCMLFQDKDVSELWEDELADIRRKRIGFVYQDFHLLDSLSAIQNIILPAMIDKVKENVAEKRAYALAEQLELSKNLLAKAPYELSGGEKQRVAICRALMNNPDLVLADEPTGNLDEESGRLVSAILKDINATMKKAIIMVTHNPQLASTTDKVCLLKRGKIAEVLVQNSAPEDYYKMILQKM